MSSELIEWAGSRFEGAPPEEILEWAYQEFGDGLTMATGFGAEGMVLIDIASRISPTPNIFFLDTGFLFAETYQLRERLQQRYGIEIRAVRTALSPEAQEQLYGPRLWATNPDLCCLIRKIEPLKTALRDSAAWITAIRRDQTPQRATSRVVEWDQRWHLVKVNPLAAWTRRDVWKYILRNDVPYNPMYERGYTSIGCQHCTRAVAAGEDERAGRWSGHQKTECGLHGGNSLAAAAVPLTSITAAASIGTNVASAVEAEPLN